MAMRFSAAHADGHPLRIQSYDMDLKLERQQPAFCRGSMNFGFGQLPPYGRLPWPLAPAAKASSNPLCTLAEKAAEWRSSFFGPLHWFGGRHPAINGEQFKTGG
ncbi:MAG: hypothetical protein EOP39_04115 [Rubrivivax sp.]|nr:MAG: hypothetical protein EOP39_04115 [Rubrivivax sp.]